MRLWPVENKQDAADYFLSQRGGGSAGIAPEKEMGGKLHVDTGSKDGITMALPVLWAIVCLVKGCKSTEYIVGVFMSAKVA